MHYEIETTNVFDKWFAGITDIRHRARIAIRLDHIRIGNFGDHKSLGGGLFELRFFFGPGFRSYYTVRNGRVVFLLTGGDKSTQAKDIEKGAQHHDRLGGVSNESDHQKMGHQRAPGQPRDYPRISCGRA